MKLIISLVLIFIATATAASQDFSQFDLSTDEGVNAAREAIAGRKLDERSKNCLQRDQSLRGVVVVGSFAFDRGCRLEGVFVNSRYFGADDKGMSQSALEALGWKTAKQQQREKLAQAWVKEGLLGFLTVVSKENEHFAGRTFQPPQTITGADGETVVTLWIRLPSGRTRGTTYQLREYRFARAGDFTGRKTLDEFTATRD